MQEVSMTARFLSRRRTARRGRMVVLAAVGVGLATLIGRLLGYGFGLHTVVRCRQGHLFSTIWIPGVKLKALDLGVARVQRCPVGRHWSIVTPVRDRDLTGAQREFAGAHRDVAIP
jgi:hypothetical protein